MCLLAGLLVSWLRVGLFVGLIVCWLVSWLRVGLFVGVLDCLFVFLVGRFVVVLFGF